MPEQTTTAAQRDMSTLYTPIAIVIAGVLIGGGLMMGLSQMGSSVGTGTGGAPIAVDIDEVDVSNSPYIGERNAPVVLAYWSDYQCPYCKAVEMGHPQIPTPPALPDVISQYVDTGKVKIVFKDYAFLGPDSTTAALWGRSIWALYPEKFWEWREKMYEAQDEEHGGFGDEASILALTKTISGIDANRVKADVAANTATYQALIDADRDEGTRMGISGTPGFITGKVMIPGAVPFSDFKTAIDAQL